MEAKGGDAVSRWDGVSPADMVDQMSASENEIDEDIEDSENAENSEDDAVDEGAEDAEGDADAEGAPTARVDARLLEASLLNLRKRIAGIPMVFDLPGTREVEEERGTLLSQIDDYLLPRLRESAAPLLVALVGSTGAGKSTLVNSIVGAKVSLTGVRRPTTNSPVLACHPDDVHWFAENLFLPTLPRVRQEGLARPGRDGLLVLASIEQMPRGIALLDTPDIDSVAASHREFAYKFLDASDLWLFMTSASRYADAPVWEILRHARERGAALGIVLSRVPAAHRDELSRHFGAMLEANGVVPSERFVIPETSLADGMLPDEIFAPIKEWMTDTGQREDRRVAVLSQTMSGVLDTFKARVPKLAAHVDAQVMLATRLRMEAESAYLTAYQEIDAGTRNGKLLGGEVLARWEDYASSGDLATELRGKRLPRKSRRAARKGAAGGTRDVTRGAAFDEALRSALEKLVGSVADRAAEQVSREWRADPAGAALLSDAAASRARGEEAEREFESAFGGGPEVSDGEADSAGRSEEGFSSRAARAVREWQDQLTQSAQTAAGGSIAGEPLGLLVITAMLADGSQGDDDIVVVPRKLLTSAVGAVATRELLSKARADFTERLKAIMDEELLRYGAMVAAAGYVDPVAAVRLYQAEYALEAAR